MTTTTFVFDAYGTLFDVAAAARELAEEPGQEEFAEHWRKVAEVWRLKQLQYTWIRAITGAHTDFWEVTQNALDNALDVVLLNGEEHRELRERLLQLYWELSAYPEVPKMLQELKDAGLNTAILSNGSPDMLEGAVKSAGIGPLLDDVLSVEDVGIFKPDHRVYELVTKRFDCKPEEVIFVSSNGWDAAAASGFGFRSCWVHRNSGDQVDRLPWKPEFVLEDLKFVADLRRV
ncbi:haloacid dehalogenase type II [Shimia gijangensis]|nr:haloacid dehalogenase type II [Shimia gijangensis]